MFWMAVSRGSCLFWLLWNGDLVLVSRVERVRGGHRKQYDQGLVCDGTLYQTRSPVCSRGRCEGVT